MHFVASMASFVVHKLAKAVFEVLSNDNLVSWSKYILHLITRKMDLNNAYWSHDKWLINSIWSSKIRSHDHFPQNKASCTSRSKTSHKWSVFCFQLGPSSPFQIWESSSPVSLPIVKWYRALQRLRQRQLSKFRLQSQYRTADRDSGIERPSSNNHCQICIWKCPQGIF